MRTIFSANHSTIASLSAKRLIKQSQCNEDADYIQPVWMPKGLCTGAKMWTGYWESFLTFDIFNFISRHAQLPNCRDTVRKAMSLIGTLLSTWCLGIFLTLRYSVMPDSIYLLIFRKCLSESYYYRILSRYRRNSVNRILLINLLNGYIEVLLVSSAIGKMRNWTSY